MQASLSTSTASNKTHFYSSSGGNAGLAAVHAAAKLGFPCSVIVPTSTKPMMMAKLQAAGATQVVQHGASWREADAYLREVVLKRAEAEGGNGVYVPPFDHPDIWTGHASMVDEIRAQLCSLTRENDAAPDVVACSVGGGGLFNGIMEGVSRVGWKDTNVLAVETRGADSLAQSLEQGELITLPAITSLATSLGATKVSDRTFELAAADPRVKSVVLTDKEAMMGAWRLAEDERLLVELACSVTVALCYGGRLERALGRKVRGQDKVVIVVCGGSNVGVDMVAQWKADSAGVDGEAGVEERAFVPSAALE